jgi:hypothetical protein
LLHFSFSDNSLSSFLIDDIVHLSCNHRVFFIIIQNLLYCRHQKSCMYSSISRMLKPRTAKVLFLCLDYIQSNPVILKPLCHLQLLFFFALFSYAHDRGCVQRASAWAVWQSILSSPARSQIPILSRHVASFRRDGWLDVIAMCLRLLLCTCFGRKLFLFF